MEKKLWSNAEVVELGLENTKSEGGCSVNFDSLPTGDVETHTDGIIIGCVWNPSKYQAKSFWDRSCKHFDWHSPCFCKLKGENLS